MYINNGKNKDMWIKSVRKNIMAERGITLLALIITVVIMIILAAVTINVTLGDGGLVDQAKWAAEKTANSTKTEQEQLDDVASQINDIIAGIGSGGDVTNSTGGEDTNQVGETNTVDTNSVEETNTVDTNTIEPEPEPLPDNTITIGEPQWQTDGTANIAVNTTEDGVTIEYQIGGTDEDGWTTVEGGTITGIENGETVYVRITDGEQSSNPQETTVRDETAPTVTVQAQGTPTTNSISVSVSAEDKETGMADSLTYTYYIKESSQPDENYAAPENAQGITNNTYTFTGLTAGTSYDIKVEVNGDKAGHVGTGFLTGQQTGTIPGGEEGVEQGRITFGPANWADGKASVTISTDTGLQLQYQINAIDPDGWTPIENNGTVSNLEAGDTVYARLTDGTNFGDYASTNILDNEVPAKATIQPNTTNLLIGESLTATVTHSDAKSGVDINASGWVLNTNASAIGTEDTSAYTGKFITNGETITLDSSNAGTYYLHVLTTDVAGNKTETVSEAITISGITGTVTQNGQVNWSAGQASISLATTESQYTIVYKINGEGSWQTYNGTSITGLNHGDTVTACLTNASQTTYGPEATFEIKDETNPTVTVTAQGSPTTNSITVTVVASDNESGMVASPTYTFQYKTSGAGSYTTPSGAENISNATYTFTGLKQNTTYDIQVIVNGDNAGNTGTGTTQATTATVPGADEGLATGSITASPATWDNYKASTTLTTTTNFKIQYQVNGTSEGSWSAAANSPVTVSNLDHGNTVYARLTDGANPGNYAAINILDGKAPTVSVEVGEVTDTTIAVTVNATDNESGLADSNAYKYYLNDEETPRETSNSNTYKYEGLTATTPYNIKVEVVDKGNNPGTGTAQATTEISMPEGWDGTKVTPVQSSDGKTVPVPIGYTASSASGETSVNEGFVIYEGTGAVNNSNVSSAKTSRNQFVWIPVDDISQIANQTSGIDANGRQNYQGKLYNFSTSGATERSNYGQGTTSYREPDVVTGSRGTSYDGSSTYLKILGLSSSSQFKTQLQEEFNEMIESVDTYGGFYIGRYETGNLVASANTKPVVVKGNNSISSVNWYYMYQNSKLIGANNNVASTMIWGSMWDRALIWLTETGDKTYSDLMNSSSWGNYSNSTGAAATNSGSKQPTGTNEAWQANNIYDLAGNVYDWTIEANDTNGRVTRGGRYNRNGSYYPASSRSFNSPSSTLSDYGSRSALYIKVGL